MEVKPGYKQTKVGVIPEDWETAGLAQLSAFITKGSTPTTYGFEWEQTGVLFLRSECVSEFGLDLTQSMYISEAAHSMLGRSEVIDGDILLTITGNVGRAVVLAGVGRGNINQHIARVRITSPRAASKFVFHALSQPSTRRRFVSITTGQAYPQISLQQVREAEVALPPTEAEQVAIAEALSDADALINSLEQLLVKKRQLKQGARRELLTGKKRLPGFENNPRQKQTEVGLIPEDWSALSLGELARGIFRGASPRPIGSPIWFDERSRIGWVRISDVTKSSRYLYETTQRLSELGVRNSRFVPSGSLIMSICATVGRPVETRLDVCIHDGFVVFERPKTDQAFLYHVLKDLEPRWSGKGQTGSQMNLNTALIKSTKIPLPPTKAEQEAIAAVLSDMDADIALLVARLTKAHGLKQGMMQKLLTGRIRLV